MGRYVSYIAIITLAIMISSCGGGKDSELNISGRDIIQQDNGSIVLDINDAYLMEDRVHPELSTAEWRFHAMSAGRYELWLTSYTLDTMDLRYEFPVIVNFGEKIIKANPVGNEIVLNSVDQMKNYFRADSNLGSVYINEPGEYNIQVLSEKVRPDEKESASSVNYHTMLGSLTLKPMTE